MSDDKLDVEPALLRRMYSELETMARQLAPTDIRREVRISQDERNKTIFHVAVSDRMATHLLAAAQKLAEREYGIMLKSHFYNLQEQLMVQMFAGTPDRIDIRFGR
jgi:regulator of protease activity HflC (stomatin/prohibitin superfamily)